MKIIIFPSSFFPVPGGVQEVALRLLKEFREKGHDVTIITQRYPRYLKKSEVIENVPVYRILFPNLVPANYNLKILLKYILGLFLAPFSFFRLLHLLRQKRPDLIYLHFVGTGSLYLLACKFFIPFKLIVTLHGDDVEGLPFLGRFHNRLFTMTCKRADFVTAVSNDLLRKGIALCPSIAQKSIAIHNGLDLGEYGDIRAYAHRRPYIFAAGRFVSKKGFDVLIKSFHLITEKGYNPDLILAGDGPEFPSYIELANALKVNWVKRNQSPEEKSPCLIFWGWANKEEMRSLMAGSEVFLVPSRKEPFGLVILEAMASGTPVIATKVGGIPEILSDGCGLLVFSEDVNGLSEAIARVLAERELREGLLIKGKERAREFNWKEVAQEYLDLETLVRA